MIICICHAISDKEIQKAIEDGAAAFDEYANQVGIGDDCGSCHHFARKFFEEYAKKIRDR